VVAVRGAAATGLVAVYRSVGGGSLSW